MYANTGLLLARIVMLMPMFIKTLFLALLFVSGSALAEWQHVGTNPQGDLFYIDLATIRKDGNMRTMWRKTEYKKRTKYGDFSARGKFEIDCKRELVRLLAFTTFSEPNLLGNLMFKDDTPNDSFQAIAPDTIDNTFMQLVCK
jgi:hypothetical protein